MPKKLAGSDRKALLKLAASLPLGDLDRRAILAGLQKVSRGPHFQSSTGGPPERMQVTFDVVDGTRKLLSGSAKFGDLDSWINFLANTVPASQDPSDVYAQEDLKDGAGKLGLGQQELDLLLAADEPMIYSIVSSDNRGEPLGIAAARRSRAAVRV